MLNDLYEDLLEDIEERNTECDMELNEDGTDDINEDEIPRNYSDAESFIDEHDLIMMQETEDEEQLNVNNVTGREQITVNEAQPLTGIEQIIIDKAQSSFEEFEGQYGPYFSDYTSMMLFTWINKHQICV